MAKFNISDLTITGTYSPCFWDKSLNPNATITDGLANCTTLTYGLTILYNRPLPVSRIVSAGQWHNYLINNWTCKKFDKSILKVGDIIELSLGGKVSKFEVLSLSEHASKDTAASMYRALSE